jgi:hypothetical protein
MAVQSDLSDARLTISLNAEGDAIARAQADLKALQGGIEKAIPAAINRALGSTKTFLVHRMEEELDIGLGKGKRDKRSIIEATGGGEKRIKLTNYNDGGYGSMRITTKGIGAFNFATAPVPRGIAAHFFKQGGDWVDYPAGFVAKGANHSNMLLYQRDYKAEKKQPTKGRYATHILVRGKHKGEVIRRQPLTALRGPSIAQYLGWHPELVTEVEKKLAGDFGKNLDSQVNRLLKRSVSTAA